MNILNYLNVLDYDKDGVPDGCDECPNTYGNGKNGCTCNTAMAERYELEAENMLKRAQAVDEGINVLSILGLGSGVGGAAAFAILNIGTGGWLLVGMGFIYGGSAIAAHYKSKALYDEAEELRRIASNYRKGCTE